MNKAATARARQAADTENTAAVRCIPLKRDPTELVNAVQTALGENPEDVRGLLKSSAKVLDWMEVIFDDIGRESQENGPHAPQRIKTLVSLGQYLAQDFSSTMDCASESMERAMVGAGVRSRGAQ